MKKRLMQIGQAYDLIETYKNNANNINSENMDRMVKFIVGQSYSTLITKFVTDMEGNEYFTIEHKILLARALMDSESSTMLDYYNFINNATGLPVTIVDNLSDCVCKNFNNSDKIYFAKLLRGKLPVKSSIKIAQAISRENLESDEKIAQACLDYALAFPELPLQAKIGLAKTVLKYGDVNTCELFATKVEGVPIANKKQLLDKVNESYTEEVEQPKTEEVVNNTTTALAIQIDVADILNIN